MTDTKEADLVTAVLLYAMRCVEEGDQQALRGMQFRPKEVEALRDLELSDLYRIGALKAHCLDIRLNRDVFWPIMGHLRTVRESEELQRDLIEADAPLDMMRTLFGMGSREYTRWRRLLALQPAVGRPPEPDEATAHRLWQALSPRMNANAATPLAAADYLAVHRESGAPMRAIWNLVQRWSLYGDVYAPREPTAGHR